MFFPDLDLSHKRTRDRVRLCLGLIDGQDEFDGKDLVQACGQPNKPLGRLLRRCFFQRPIIVAMRLGERKLYKALPEAVDELRGLLKAYED